MLARGNHRLGEVAHAVTGAITPGRSNNAGKRLPGGYPADGPRERRGK